MARTRSEPWAEQAALIALGAEESFEEVTLAAVAAAIQGARDAAIHDVGAGAQDARLRMVSEAHRQRDDAREHLRRSREDVELAHQQRDDGRAILAVLVERTANLLAATTQLYEYGKTWPSTKEALERARTFLVSETGVVHPEHPRCDCPCGAPPKPDCTCDCACWCHRLPAHIEYAP